MRQQRSDTKKRPSRFCKFLLLLVGFKLCLLGVVLVEPFVSVSSFLPVLGGLSDPGPSGSDGSAVTAGPAADSATPAAQAETAPDLAPRSLPAGAAFAASAEPPAQPDQPRNGPDQPGNVTLDALNRKQEELARREQDLKALQQELDARLLQMQALEQRLQTMLRDAEETKGEKYKHLVDVLANMKSRQAAEVLETLDEKIAVRVLAGMRGRQAGEILTYATPAKAARLTEALARMQLPLE